jgi:uncharacterized membrane protein
VLMLNKLIMFATLGLILCFTSSAHAVEEKYYAHVVEGPAGPYDIIAKAISNGNSGNKVVVGRMKSAQSDKYTAFLWSPQSGGPVDVGGFLEDLLDTTFVYSEATGIDDQGNVTGNFLFEDFYQYSFIITPIEILIGPLGTQSAAIDSGYLVGTVEDVEKQPYVQVFTWSYKNGYEELGGLVGGFINHGNGVNSSGQCVGFLISNTIPFPPRAFFHEPATSITTILPTPGPNWYSFADGMNDTGSVCGRTSPNGATPPTACYWKKIGGLFVYVPLGDPGIGSFARAINNNDVVVGETKKGLRSFFATSLDSRQARTGPEQT